MTSLSQYLSSGKHGQTEIINTHLEQFLRLFWDITRADGADCLQLAEFAANNNVFTTTGMSPFFGNLGQHSRLSFSSPCRIQVGALASKRKINQARKFFVTKMEEITNLLYTNMLSTQASQEHQANANRSRYTESAILVFLDSRNINSARPMERLDNKFLGPFPVSKVFNSHAYQLDLPVELEKLH